MFTKKTVNFTEISVKFIEILYFYYFNGLSKRNRFFSVYQPIKKMSNYPSANFQR